MKLTIEKVENGYILDQPSEMRVCVYSQFEGLISDISYRFGECHIDEVIKIVKEKA